MRRTFIVSLLIVMAISVVGPAQEKAEQAASKVSSEKQTVLGLYLTAKEAYARWKADPEHVKILDARTPEEYVFVGHPAMAWNIPLKFVTHEWDAGKKNFVVKSSPAFVAQVKQVVKPHDTLLVICGSGGRSAAAVNLLAKAGFTKVYSVTDGFEGDTVEDPESVFHGLRMKNGWKNSGLPWTYQLDPALVYHPAKK